MITKLVNYYNSQYSEDKAIMWVFVLSEIFLVFIGIVLFVVYSLMLSVANSMD